MAKGYYSKFAQHADLLQCFRHTGNLVLAEASYDPFWGTGIPLGDTNAADSTVWKGSNHLGNVLITVRKTFVDANPPAALTAAAAHMTG